jgi:AcrR family transcriptional regulator
VPTHKPCEGILNKKQNIIQAATRLFAGQIFEGTTAHRLVREADGTEPPIYYHFKSKYEPFSYILETSSKEYFSRPETLEREPGNQFERIEAMRGLDEALRERKVKKCVIHTFDHCYV